MNEIHGKLMLVRVTARFELVRVRVIGIQLYVQNKLVNYYYYHYYGPININ